MTATHEEEMTKKKQNNKPADTTDEQTKAMIPSITPSCPVLCWLTNCSLTCLSYGLGRRNKEHREVLLEFHRAT